jgi:hypothetical protein
MNGWMACEWIKGIQRKGHAAVSASRFLSLPIPSTVRGHVADVISNRNMMQDENLVQNTAVASKMQY